MTYSRRDQWVLFACIALLSGLVLGSGYYVHTALKEWDCAQTPLLISSQPAPVVSEVSVTDGIMHRTEGAGAVVSLHDVSSLVAQLKASLKHSPSASAGAIVELDHLHRLLSEFSYDVNQSEGQSGNAGFQTEAARLLTCLHQGRAQNALTDAPLRWSSAHYYAWSVSGLLLISVLIYRWTQNIHRHDQITRKFYQLTPHAVVVVDEHGQLLFSNPKFFAIFEIAPDTPLEFINPKLLFGQSLEAVIEKLRSRSTGYLDMSGWKHSGVEVLLRLRGSALEHSANVLFLIVIEDMTEKNQLLSLAATDYLTKAHNRRFAEAKLKDELYRVSRYQSPLTVMLIDIDDFKRINDQYGHPKGDEVLISVVACIESVLRECDTISRWGGDEIICIFPGLTANAAEKVAQKLQKVMTTWRFDVELPVTLSIGIHQTQKGELAREVLVAVDNALYQAKERGKNCFATL